MFSVKADIINQIAARLVSEAQEAANLKIANRDPKSLDVFENVLRARWSHRLYTREGAFEAFALTERAVELDANYAAAWEILSRAHIQFYVQPYDRRRGDPETLERAITAARNFESSFTGRVSIFSLSATKSELIKRARCSRWLDSSQWPRSDHSY